MLETAVQLEREPPETVTLDSMKLVKASEMVNVSAAVSPAFKEETSELLAMVAIDTSKIRIWPEPVSYTHLTLPTILLV